MLSKSNCKRVFFFLLLLCFTDIKPVKANTNAIMPMPILVDSNKKIDREITSIEQATAIKSKDGEYSSLILNKAVKEPLKLGDLGKGKVRIQAVVGMIEDEPVVMAEKDSVMEQQLIKKVDDKIKSDKTEKYVAILGCVAFLLLTIFLLASC
ncbi:ATP-binding protein [Clostridium botulinum]|nr:ATP-binding protein [Clostridium botulinum]